MYRAAPADTLVAVPLDAFTAVFHRPSGITHLLTDPAPQILAAMGTASMTAEAVMASLTEDYDLADTNPAVLAERLEELVAAGLVERV